MPLQQTSLGVITALGLSWLAISCPSQAQLVGGQFQVNTSTAGSQHSPDVAMAPDGSFIVVWSHTSSSIRAQRFSPLGAPIGDEITVDDLPLGRRTIPAVTFDGTGKFIVTWASGVGDQEDCTVGPTTEVLARRFDGAASPIGEEILVAPANQSTRSIDIGATADGEWVIVWHDVCRYDFSFSSSVSGSRFDAEGAFLAPVDLSQVPVLEFYSQLADPALAVRASGEFAVLLSEQQDTLGWVHYEVLRGLRFDPQGLPLEKPLEVADASWPIDFDRTLGLDAAGNLVVAWEDGDVHTRRYSSVGEALGSPMKLTDDESILRLGTRIAVQPSGEALVVWWEGPDAGDIRGRHLQGDGSAPEGPFRINAFTPGKQAWPAVAAASSDGTFVAVWTSDGPPESDSSGTSIQAQLFRWSLFADGFESGEISAWEGHSS